MQYAAMYKEAGANTPGNPVDQVPASSESEVEDAEAPPSPSDSTIVPDKQCLEDIVQGAQAENGSGGDAARSLSITPQIKVRKRKRGMPRYGLLPRNTMLIAWESQWTMRLISASSLERAVYLPCVRREGSLMMWIIS